jgi:hypothetical protein
MLEEEAAVECARLIKECMLEFNSKTIQRYTLLNKWKKKFPDHQSSIYPRYNGERPVESTGTVARKLISKACRKLEQDGIISRHEGRSDRYGYIVVEDVKALVTIIT